MRSVNESLRDSFLGSSCVRCRFIMNASSLKDKLLFGELSRLNGLTWDVNDIASPFHRTTTAILKDTMASGGSDMVLEPVGQDLPGLLNGILKELFTSKVGRLNDRKVYQDT